MKRILFYICMCLFSAQFPIASTDEQCIYYRNGNVDYVEEISCNQTTLCNKEFIIVTMDMPPYSDKEVLNDIINKCCGKCCSDCQMWIYLPLNNFVISELMGQIREEADFIYPFLGYVDAEFLYEWYFIPVAPVTSFIYVTRNDENILVELVSSVVKLYPLIIICITLAIISGFIIWLSETWWNKDEFPRPFFKGWFEGFWWSFISMTTVGYGDKTPKKAISRLFSVLWIIMGIALFNIVTGEITSALLKANNPPPPTVREKTVGVLKYLDADKSYVTKNGGHIYHAPEEAENFYLELHHLIYVLRVNKTIDGILMDKRVLFYAMSYFTTMDKTKPDYETFKRNAEFMESSTLRTEKIYEGETMAYGIIVKDKRNYEFFGKAIKDNLVSLMMLRNLSWNEDVKTVSSEGNLFNESGHYFLTGIKVISGIIGFIILFGIVYEVRRRMISGGTSKETVEYELDNA